MHEIFATWTLSKQQSIFYQGNIGVAMDFPLIKSHECYSCKLYKFPEWMCYIQCYPSIGVLHTM